MASKTLLGKLWFRVLLGLVLGIGFGLLIGNIEAVEGQHVGGKELLTSYIKPFGFGFGS